MSRWNIIDKWVITDVKTDEAIILYNGTFIEVTDFLNKFYEDGRVDVETYENWLSRQQIVERKVLWLAIVDIGGRI